MHRFFKIILDDTCRDGKLVIPRRFARNYGNNLSSPVILKVRSGAKWQVELVKCDGEMWLQNGWQEFMKFYSLTHGSFLVFEYDEKICNFNVIIFGKSASEIDYPFSEANVEPNLEKHFQGPNIQETANAASVETLNHSSPYRKSKRTSLLPCRQPHKKMKFENPTRNMNPHSVTERLEGGTGFEATNGNGGMYNQKRRLNGIVSLTREAKANALQRASTKFESKNPFFMCAMQASFVHRGYRVNIPQSFAKKNLRSHGNAILSTLDGRTWSVEYKIGRDHGTTRARLSHGWKKFAVDNHLEVGDVCVFELINRTKPTFRVTVFQDSIGSRKQLKTKLSQKHSSSVPPESIEAANKFISMEPFLRLVIRSYHLKLCSVYAPKEFMVKYTKRNTEKVTLVVGNRQWRVKIISHPSYGHGRFSTGWHAFAKGNSLQVGDVCIFELINSENMLIKVSIFGHVK